MSYKTIIAQLIFVRSLFNSEGKQIGQNLLLDCGKGKINATLWLNGHKPIIFGKRDRLELELGKGKTVTTEGKTFHNFKVRRILSVTPLTTDEATSYGVASPFLFAESDAISRCRECGAPGNDLCAMCDEEWEWENTHVDLSEEIEKALASRRAWFGWSED